MKLSSRWPAGRFPSLASTTRTGVVGRSPLTSVRTISPTWYETTTGVRGGDHGYWEEEERETEDIHDDNAEEEEEEGEGEGEGEEEGEEEEEEVFIIKY